MEPLEKYGELPIGNDLETILNWHSKFMEVGVVPSISEPISNILKGIVKSYSIFIEALKMKEQQPEDFKKKFDKTKYLLDFNTQISMSLFNLVTILKESRLTNGDIINFYETKLDELNLKDSYFFPDNGLRTIMQYARYQNIMDMVYNNPELNLRVIAFGNTEHDKFLMGGKILNINYGHLLSEHYWAVTYHSTKTLDLFENISNDTMEKYQLQVMDLVLYFFKALDLLGHNDESVGRLYSVYYHITNQK